MQRIARILFPVDFSDRCALIGGRVKALAEHFQAEVILLYALEPLPPHVAALDMTPLIPETTTALEEAARVEVERFLKKELSHLSVRRVLAEGVAADAIVQHAHALQADLILMPTRGLSTFRRYIIGSVTAKILHDANCPVWTGVHHEKAPHVLSELRHVVCAVDLGPQSVAALTWASGFASQWQSKLTLLHVAPALEPSPGQYFDPNWRISYVSSTREELQKLRDSVGADCDIHVDAGEAAKAVVADAATLKADLLVIGRSPHSGLVGRLRANAYAIITQSPCPVVSV